MKLGFPGIGNDHMSLIPFSEIKEGDWFIWDLYVESMDRSGDEAPILFEVLEIVLEIQTVLIIDGWM